MKKLLTLIAVLILCLTACEPDDICLEGTTGSPNLIVVFYDKNQTDTKKSVTDLQIKGLDMETLLYDSTTDSISLPIKTISNSTSFSLIATQNGNTLEDIITFNYDPEDKFISRACGFKTRFNNLTFSTSNTLNWVEFIEILTNSISDTNNTHVKILH
tara:strand:- start:24 stop:497 length:474 start_codon:yes stop_codon:yes gene_type:complete